MTIESILALVASTGIGVAVYGILESLKPVIKVVGSMKWVKWAITKFKNHYKIADTTMPKIWDMMVRVLVFVLAFGFAYNMGPNGDLFVLMGIATKTSWVGYIAMSGCVAFGDHIADAIEQAKK